MGNLSLRDAIGELNELSEHYSAVHESTKTALRQGAPGNSGQHSGGLGDMADYGQNDLSGKIGDFLQQSTTDLLRQSIAAANARPTASISPKDTTVVPADDGVVIDGEARRVQDE